MPAPYSGRNDQGLGGEDQSATAWLPNLTPEFTAIRETAMCKMTRLYYLAGASLLISSGAVMAGAPGLYAGLTLLAVVAFVDLVVSLLSHP